MSDQVVRIRASTDPPLTHHRPTHIYESRAPCPIYASYDGNPADIRCQLHTNIRESQLSCDECVLYGDATVEPLILHRSYTAAPFSFPKVWQDTDTPNLTTGRVETDPRKFAIHLADESKRMEDRLNARGGNQKVDYQPVDPTDTTALGVTDEGLDATHNHRVASGQRDSKGRFVWQV